MDNNKIKKAKEDLTVTIISEMTSELKKHPNFGLQFKENPIRIGSVDGPVVQVRFADERILVGFDTDTGVEEDDLRLFFLDEMLAIAERVF